MGKVAGTEGGCLERDEKDSYRMTHPRLESWFIRIAVDGKDGDSHLDGGG